MSSGCITIVPSKIDGNNVLLDGSALIVRIYGSLAEAMAFAQDYAKRHKLSYGGFEGTIDTSNKKKEA